jgi:hypothetical protein
LLAVPAVVAFLALNFTGSTPHASRTGVRREMATYVPVIAGLFGVGVVLTILSLLLSGVRPLHPRHQRCLDLAGVHDADAVAQLFEPPVDAWLSVHPLTIGAAPGASQSS